jgi:hypothetical protein
MTMIVDLSRWQGWTGCDADGSGYRDAVDLSQSCCCSSYKSKRGKRNTTSRLSERAGLGNGIKTVWVRRSDANAFVI